MYLWFRKPGEGIIIDNVRVVVLAIGGGQVRLAVDAPRGVKVKARSRTIANSVVVGATPAPQRRAARSRRAGGEKRAAASRVPDRRPAPAVAFGRGPIRTVLTWRFGRPP